MQRLLDEKENRVENLIEKWKIYAGLLSLKECREVDRSDFNCER